MNVIGEHLQTRDRGKEEIRELQPIDVWLRGYLILILSVL